MDDTLSETIVGIDLGTTNSVVGLWKNGMPQFVGNRRGNQLTPSMVSYTPDEDLVGDDAKNKFTMNPANTLYDMKRLIGKKWNNEDIKKNEKYWTFKLEQKQGMPVAVVTKGQTKLQISPEEVSGMVLEELKKCAEKITRHPVSKAVITVPAYFSQQQRIATKVAAEKAGLEVVSLLNEPSAAAYAYGFDRKELENYNLLVFDFGGGTLDVVIVKVNRGKFRVVSIGGDTQLGGRDIDILLMEHVAKKIKEDHQIDIFAEPINECDERKKQKMKQKLNRACVKAKVTLSTAQKAEIWTEHFVPEVEDEIIITREQLEEIIAPILQKIETITRDAIDYVRPKMKPSNINEVLLVGGSSRIPAIQKLLKKIFPDINLNESLNMDTAIAYGATMRAAQLMNMKDNGLDKVSVLDATPLSIGDVSYNEIFEPIIKRGTNIPTKPISKSYSTCFNDQPTMSFHIYEGERPIAMHNTFLGSFELEGITLGMAASQCVKAVYQIDKDGILTVNAYHGDKQASLEIDYKGEIENRDVDKTVNELIEEADMHREEDKAEKSRIELKGNVVVLIEQILNKLGTYPIEAEKSLMETKCHGMQQWLEENEDAPIKDYRSKKRSLDTIYRKVKNPRIRRGRKPASRLTMPTSRTARKTPYTIHRKHQPQEAKGYSPELGSFPHLANAIENLRPNLPQSLSHQQQNPSRLTSPALRTTSNQQDTENNFPSYNNTCTSVRIDSTLLEKQLENTSLSTNSPFVEVKMEVIEL